jgi:hypothetical protein
MMRTLVDYYRCPEDRVRYLLCDELSPELGYFKFGPNAICYGGNSKGKVCTSAKEELYDVFKDVLVQEGIVHLPFDPIQVVDALHFERYSDSSRNQIAGTLVGKLYYLVRPFLGVRVRRRLQKLRVGDWDSIPFPRWPVDRTVEQVHERLLRICLERLKGEEIPFIWFWPEGYSSCIAVTHDVETTKGRDFCPALMDLDDSFGIKSSFQVIPEDKYSLGTAFLENIRSRGFELNIHDLNHDGRLFVSHEQFLHRALRINEYARAYSALGFRSAVLYRNLAWYDALEFSYDMSVPNSAPLDPQRGGCCTVFPYFVGDILEIPLTTTQDYSLFHLLTEYSIDLWQQQLDIIGKSFGLASFNIHPDYVIEPKARSIYLQLLEHIGHLSSDGEIWLALPREIDRWWRNRSQMRIVLRGGEWEIEGLDNQRAILAYARIRGNELEYSWTAADGRRTTQLCA